MTKDAGFTILEVVIALLILAIVMGVIAYGITANATTNGHSELQTQASVAAQQVLDRARTYDPAGMPSSGTSAAETVSVGGRNFQVAVTYCRVASYCTSTAKMLTAKVSYLGQTVFSLETVYTSVNTATGN